MKTGLRLLSEKEKEYILNYCQNKENWPSVYRNPVPYVLISIIIGVLFGYSFGQAFDDTYIFSMPVSTFVQGCIVGLFIFADCILLFFGVNSNILKAFKSLPEKVKTDQVEVEEVTYSGSSVRSGKYTRVWLYFKEDSYTWNDLHICEYLAKNGKYIILQMKGKKWVFKARK